jgi:hypothetical protein
MKKQASEQKQTTQDPQDIGKLNLPNLMIWMLKTAYEKTTIKRVTKELKHLEKNVQQHPYKYSPQEEIWRKPLF